MQVYQPRKIAFKELLEVGEWKIKVYTISKTGDFSNPEFYERVKTELPRWLTLHNSFDTNSYKVGFLILHLATEGIFSIVNWWVGENMLNTHIFLTKLTEPTMFDKISGDGLSACVWELDVINYESKSWIRNVLKQGPEPDFRAYLYDVYSGII